MSIKIMSEVWEYAPLVGTDLLVLLALADMANDDHRECWPSYRSISHKSRISIRQVANVVNDLELQGILTISNRFTENGAMTSKLYRINEVQDWSVVVSYDLDNEDYTPLKHSSTPPRTTVREGAEAQFYPPVSNAPSAAHTNRHVNPNKKPKKETILASDDAPTEAQLIVNLIKAYLDASGTVKPAMYGNKTIRAEAKELANQGITPLHICTYIQRLRLDEFWKNKEVKWAKVCGEIIVHFKDNPLVEEIHKPAPQSTPPVYKPSAKVQQREAEFQEWMKKGQPMNEEEF